CRGRHAQAITIAAAPRNVLQRVIQVQGSQGRGAGCRPDAGRGGGAYRKGPAARRDLISQRRAGGCREWLATVGCAIQKEGRGYFRDGAGHRERGLREVATEARNRKAECLGQALPRKCGGLSSLS